MFFAFVLALLFLSPEVWMADVGKRVTVDTNLAEILQGMYLWFVASQIKSTSTEVI